MLFVSTDGESEGLCTTLPSLVITPRTVAVNSRLLQLLVASVSMSIMRQSGCLL